MAETEIAKGNYVKLLNFSRISKFDHVLQSQKPVLGSKPTGSSIEFMPDIDDISSTDDSEDEDLSKVTGQVLGVQSLYLYSCCINPPCCKKKLQNNICTTCNMHYTAASAGSGAVRKILLQRNGMNMQTYTMFTELIQSLLSCMNCDTALDSTTVSRIVNKIPFTVSYVANGNKLAHIKYIL
ncbi:uncharacterized protein LOC134257031 [Saccostrea cucullata]|uniref:uncharacterized protein LOC134257031 n=1 Tax=Saccostrea cuccullata TaxID=36930 RepID=UPI002ED37E08